MIHEGHRRRTRGEAFRPWPAGNPSGHEPSLDPARNVRSDGGQPRDGTEQRASPLNRLFSSVSFQRGGRSAEEPDEPRLQPLVATIAWTHNWVIMQRLPTARCPVSPARAKEPSAGWQ